MSRFSYWMPLSLVHTVTFLIFNAQIAKCILTHLFSFYRAGHMHWAIHAFLLFSFFPYYYTGHCCWILLNIHGKKKHVAPLLGVTFGHIFAGEDDYPIQLL